MTGLSERSGDPPRGEARELLRIVVPRYGESVVGGAEAAMRGLAHALTARGWGVEVWTTTAADESRWAQGFPAGAGWDADVAVRRFPVLGGRRPWLFKQLSRAVYHLPRPLAFVDHLWSVTQGPWSPSLVRALASSAPMPTLFSPYLYHPTLFGLPAAPRPRILCPAAHDEPALRLAVVGRVIGAADALWFHSIEERDLVRRVHPAASLLPERCGVVGLDPPADVDPAAFARRHQISGPYLYYGGRLAAGKGLDQLVAGAELLRRAHPGVGLVLSGEAGDATAEPWVRGVGRLDTHERWEAIAGAAAVVVPSVLESLSLLALEAWALGRPCLVNSRSAVLAGHAARSGGALLFGDAAELAARAAQLLEAPSEAAAMGEAGRAYVAATYRWDLAEQRLRELIQEAGQ